VYPSKRIISIVILLLVISACNGFGSSESFPDGSSGSRSLEEGFGGVRGRITNLEDFWPGRNIYIFAAYFYGDIDGEGSFILEPSTFPKTQVNDDGSFQIFNLPPRNYVFIVGPSAESGLILGGKSTTSVISIVADEIAELGDTLLPP